MKLLEKIGQINLVILIIFVAALTPSLRRDDVPFTIMHMVFSALYFVGYFCFADSIRLITQHFFSTKTSYVTYFLHLLAVAPFWLIYATVVRAIGKEFGQEHHGYGDGALLIIFSCLFLTNVAQWSVLKPLGKLLRQYGPRWRRNKRKNDELGYIELTDGEIEFTDYRY